MKSFKIFRVFALLLVMSTAIPAFAGDVIPENKTNKDAARAQELMGRLYEIKSLAKTDLSKTEKKELRKEVKEIRHEMKANQNGIYLSLGAIVIIILLLILLL